MDPDPRKEIEVDPERGLKWIRMRPTAVDPGGSGSGSETLEKSEALADIHRIDLQITAIVVKRWKSPVSLHFRKINSND